MGIKDRKQLAFERRGQDILDAALTLFATDDWEHVTVEQIAKQAEVGKGTIYKHFSSKYEIYARLAMDFQRQILQEFEKIDPSLPMIKRFELHLRAAWNLHLSSQELHRVFLFCSRPGFRANLSDATVAELKAIEIQVSAPSNQLVIDGVKEGIFPDQPLPLLLFGAQAAFWGAIQLVWSGYLGNIDREQHLNALMDFIIAGLVKK